MSVKPFKRLLMFSGGGSRFGYYLGAYAALTDQQQQPDIILASCGGSLAAALVHIAPDPVQLKHLATSQPLHAMLQRLQPKPPIYYQSNAYYTLKRIMQNFTRTNVSIDSQTLLHELQTLALFQIEHEAVQPWLDINQLTRSISPSSMASPALAMIASRICPHTLPAQLQQVVFIDQKIAAVMQHNEHECALHHYATQRIHPYIRYVSNWRLADAVRASIADMYYLPPIFIGDNTEQPDDDKLLGWCLGGVIDLTPIELANRLAQCVFAETKADYNRILAVPAIKRVFGFDANQRLNQVLRHQSNINTVLHWLPFADNAIALKGQCIQKQLNWRAGTVNLQQPSYPEFIVQMQQQWHYGYSRTQHYLQQNNLV